MSTAAQPMKVHHLGVAVPDVAAAIPVYESLLGQRLLSGPFDDPIQKVRVCFLGGGGAGDVVIELIAPLADDAPVHQYLKKGLGAYHICYEVLDMDRTLADLRTNGCLVISGPVPAVAFEGRRIAWLLMPTRQVIELVESERA
jgi:methylmalonyl-CoA/ethylmalonyl-CoA epimerase